MTEAPLSKKMFPASLLLEGRRCLVVGGGRVAARKSAKLLEAGAVLTVVAPSIREQIKLMDGVEVAERSFDENDLKDVYLVFAATDDAALNRNIVERCREKEILCSAADGSWVDGDLTMPASFSGDGLTVAVSTGGRACRRARLLREDLSRHVRFMEDLDLFILGVDSRTAGFQSLEKCKAAVADLEELFFCIRGVHEFMVLSTCNRFEVIGLVSGRAGVETLIRNAFGFSEGLTAVSGMDAFRRFAEIAAGLQSEVCGETRIVAQIKEALTVAQEKGWAGSFLQSWTDQALRISKEIRQAVEPQIPAVEIEDLVFQHLLSRRSEAKADGRMLIIGRGEIGQGLKKRFPDSAQISGRDDAEIKSQLSGAEVVICATGSHGFIIGEAHRPLLKKDTVLIDLSLPRNIDPALPGVIGLSELRATAPGLAEKLLAQVSEIIESYAGEYDRLVQFENKAE